ncbi:MAG: hypothetical protein ACQEP1_05805 [Nanobdellota archaeon]
MSAVSSHLIMFIAVISISTLVVAVFNDNIDATASSIETQQNWLSNQLKTDITIELVNYVDRAENQTTVYVENTGSTIIDTSYVDIYLSGERIERNNESRKVEVLPDTEVANEGLWDPKEQLRIIVNKTLDDNTTYDVLVTGQYGSQDKSEFST